MRKQLILTKALPPLQRLAPTGPQSLPPCFEFTFICSGKEFKAVQRGRNQAAAAAEAMLELSYQCPDFDYKDARLTAALQVQ